ncbi:hypothetical protein ACIQMY_30220 [Streptomyces sp. NPDC091368]|uniref:hypothetical protein n=1 Tax=Streptomyces sp. NPDC091368 TaxID=3365993 RepID=UPI0037FE3AF4
MRRRLPPPVVELRAQGRGCAVSLVRAAVRAGGTGVGAVRPPLSGPAPEHVDALLRLLDHGRVLLGEKRSCGPPRGRTG